MNDNSESGESPKSSQERGALKGADLKELSFSSGRGGGVDKCLDSLWLHIFKYSSRNASLQHLQRKCLSNPI